MAYPNQNQIHDPYGYQQRAYESFQNQTFGCISQPRQFCQTGSRQPSAETLEWARRISPSGNPQGIFENLNGSGSSGFGFVHTGQPHVTIYPGYYARGGPW